MKDDFSGEHVWDWPIFTIAWYYHVIVAVLVIGFNGGLFHYFGRSNGRTVCFPVAEDKTMHQAMDAHAMEEAYKNFNDYD